MKQLLITLLVCSGLFPSVGISGEKRPFYDPEQRVVFIGDSNTYAGHYIVFLESQLRLHFPNQKLELFNVGLPSETACGLSEPDHPFPRPNVHERLDRVLAKTKPDIVVACYGMNDGIYYPFSEKRLKAYQRGIGKLIDKVKAAGAKLVLLTPPPFDPLPLKKKGKLKGKGAEKYAWFHVYENYDNEVLAPYAKWILEQRQRVDMVLDIRTPMLQYLEEQRQKNPDFTMSGDGVHFNEEGHRLISDVILKAWGLQPKKKLEPQLIKLVAKRQFLLRDAWLTHTGHKRPGIRKGLPLYQAAERASELDDQIRQVLTGS